ncbi:MAG: biopolymer transporter ExbD [Thermanaerothrix sp.]|nr:biopolymer transporter ExbD [Thermanaerothrix sp.]
MRRNGPDIDMTPLLDVLFILIIFFVLTSSFAGLNLKDVLLPSGKGSAVTEGMTKTITVAVLKDGSLRVDNRPMSFEGLKDLVKGNGKGCKVLLGAHRDAPYGRVAQALEALQSLGVTSVGLLTEEPR